MTAPRILVFDSGLGGLTVFREIAALRPDASYIYAADDAYFPYGDLPEATVTDRVLSVMSDLIEEHTPDLVVIACNTASTIVLPELRARFSVPFVGTVPAIKPACALSQTRLVSVLGTEGTVTREYTQGLIRDFAQGCDVNLVGSTTLALIAEAALRREPVNEAAIAAEIAPCFVERDSRRTDVVVMACTHYPLIAEHLTRLAPWPVTWLDPSEAIARRVADLLGPAAPDAPSGPRRLIFLSGVLPSSSLQDALANYGLE